MGGDSERTYRIRRETILATVLVSVSGAALAAVGILALADQEAKLANSLRALGLIGAFAWGAWAGLLRPRVVLSPGTVRVVNILHSVEFDHARMVSAGFGDDGGLVFRLKDRSEHRSTAFGGGRTAKLRRPRAEELLADLEAIRSQATARTSVPGSGEFRRVRSWTAIGSGLLVLGTLAWSFVA